MIEQKEISGGAHDGQVPAITKKFFQNYDGNTVSLYTLVSDILTVEVLDFGAIIRSVKVKTPCGEVSVCLGFDSVEEYIASGLYCGAAIGRCANRIEDGKFTLGGKEYSLYLNEGKNHHHGGFGFDKRMFTAEMRGGVLALTLTSCDGDQGYPGKLDFTVCYGVSGGCLEMTFSGKSDKDTLFNPTSHCYFNLSGEGSGNIYDNVLALRASHFLPVRGGSIPTGEVMAVADTPFDFSSPKRIGRDIDASDAQLDICGGYDHNYCIDSGHYAVVRSQKTGIKMDCCTDMPGVQLYSGNFIRAESCAGRYDARAAFCLEPQFYPNAINTKGFTPPIIKKDETFTSVSKYCFSIDK